MKFKNVLCQELEELVPDLKMDLVKSKIRDA